MEYSAQLDHWGRAMVVPFLVVAFLAAPASIDPEAFIGIRFESGGSRPWSVEWHFDGSDSSHVSRVYLHLRSTELSHCLTSMIESDEETRTAMARYASAPTAEHAAWATKAAWRVWSKIGLEE